MCGNSWLAIIDLRVPGWGSRCPLIVVCLVQLSLCAIYPLAHELLSNHCDWSRVAWYCQAVSAAGVMFNEVSSLLGGVTFNNIHRPRKPQF